MVSVPLYVKSTKGFAKLKLMTKIATCKWTKVENTCKILCILYNFDSTYLESIRKRGAFIYIFLLFNQNFQDQEEGIYSA